MKLLRSILFCLIYALGLPSIAKAAPIPQLSNTILYATPSGSGDCTSWTAACRLQSALDIAGSGDQIWVAEGTYKPTRLTNPDDERSATFLLETGVAIYGGFPSAGGEWEERNPATYGTILSGDIGTSGDNSDNSYHVLTGGGVDATAILDGFTISGGNADAFLMNDYGGGMANISSSPKLNNLIFTGNSAMRAGGGIYNASNSNPELTDITFSTNSALAGGGMYNIDSNPTLTNVTFTGNSAGIAGGGIYNVSNSNPILTNLTFTSNTAWDGGGMANQNNSNPSLTNVTFTSNLASGLGGGMSNNSSTPSLYNVTFASNSALDGGGMYNSSSNPSLTNVTFASNSASDGGGIYNQINSNPSLTNVTFASNSASNGGGMYNRESSPTLENVTFTENSASQSSGGMFNYRSSPTLTDVTFSINSAVVFGGGLMNSNFSMPSLTNVSFVENSAGKTGGGMVNDYSSPLLNNVTFSSNHSIDEGGGMFNHYSSNASLTNVTFTGNSAGSSNFGGAIYNFKSSPLLTNAVVWGNTPIQDQILNGDVELGSVIVTYSDVEGGYPGETNINLDPFLGILADNGGLTQTHSLGAGSPAIDAGDPANCPPPATDQRGYPRPIDGDDDGMAVCDMGAYEYGYTLNVEIVGSGTISLNPDKPDYQPGETVTLDAIAAPDWAFNGWGGEATGSSNPLAITISGHTEMIANFKQIRFRYILFPIYK